MAANWEYGVGAGELLWTGGIWGSLGGFSLGTAKAEERLGKLLPFLLIEVPHSRREALRGSSKLDMGDMKCWEWTEGC